ARGGCPPKAPGDALSAWSRTHPCRCLDVAPSRSSRVTEGIAERLESDHALRGERESERRTQKSFCNFHTAQSVPGEQACPAAMRSVCAEHVEHRLRDDRLLVDGDDMDVYSRSVRRDARRRASARRVRRCVELDPEPPERGEDALANRGSVLADATAERDRIEAAEHGRIGADVLADPHAKALERERGPGIPIRLGPQQHADIV